jgi:hypothetical protein
VRTRKGSARFVIGWFSVSFAGWVKKERRCCQGGQIPDPPSAKREFVTFSPDGAELGLLACQGSGEKSTTNPS